MKRNRMRRLALAGLAALMLGAWSPAPAPAWAQAPENLAPYASVTASGREIADAWGPELVVDGDKGKGPDYRNDAKNHQSRSASRWSAENDDDVWVSLDLGAEAVLDRVTVTWAKQYAKNYAIEGSLDGRDWFELASGTQKSSGEEVTSELSGKTVRHLRVHGKNRSSGKYSMSIWEVEVLGTWKDGAPVRRPAVIPLPAVYELVDGGGSFSLDPGSEIVASGEAVPEAEKLAATLRRSTGYALPVVPASDDGVADIRLSIAAGGAEESYALDADAAGVRITAPSAHGLFNAQQTLYQLLGPWSRASFASNGPWSIPALHIEDAPRFEYRGIMLDPARSFLTVDEIKQAIDVMSLFKLSYLHLHLADDQGWRIQITNEGREPGDTIDYTRLTEISGPTAMGATEQQAKPGVGGYYTQDDLRDIVAYAAQRHITVVPEIDVPGHTTAILHAIPQLNSAGSSHDGTKDKDGRPIEDPSQWICAPFQSSWEVGESYLDPDNAETWMFIKHVVGQVTEITGSGTIHIGGDESHKMDQQRPGEYGKFLTKASQIVRDMGLKPIGWNEWANSTGETKSGDTIQYWTGNIDNVRKRVNDTGARLIWSAARNTYFPQKAGEDIWGGTWATGGLANLSSFYDYDPAAASGVAEEHIRGVEGAMWFEHGRDIQDFFFPSFPRAMALAEVGWSPQAARNGGLGDLKRRISEVVPALTVAGADFYAKDGLVHRPLVAATDAVAGTAGGAVIARGYMPETKVEAVSAKVRWSDGSEQPLEVVQNRPYLPSNGNNNNNRAQNGLFELRLAQVPAKAAEGTVEFSVGGRTASAAVHVKAATHTVSLSVDGKIVQTITVEDGKPMTEPAAPQAPAGYEFAYWSLGGERFDFSQPITSDITLTAEFRKAAPPAPGPDGGEGQRPTPEPTPKPTPKPGTGGALAQTGDASAPGALLATAALAGAAAAVLGARLGRREG